MTFTLLLVLVGITVDPSGPASTRYAESEPGRDWNAFRSALDEIVPLSSSSRLDRVATDLARVYAEHSEMPAEAVSYLSEHYGIASPVPGTIALRSATTDVRELAAELSRRLVGASGQTQMRYYGAGHVHMSGGSVAVVVLQPETPVLHPIQKRLGARESFELRGRLPHSVNSPTLWVTRPNGRVERSQVALDGRDFSVEMECHPGRNKVSLIGYAQFGESVLVNVPVYCGVHESGTFEAQTHDRPSDASEDELARDLFELVNSERVQAGLPSLEWSSELASSASAHSEDMRERGFVGHVSPRNGGPKERVTSAGIQFAALQENVARAPSVSDAHRGFLESPGHRASVMNEQATHLGIGIRRASNGELLVTQLFVKQSTQFAWFR